MRAMIAPAVPTQARRPQGRFVEACRPGQTRPPSAEWAASGLVVAAGTRVAQRQEPQVLRRSQVPRPPPGGGKESFQALPPLPSLPPLPDDCDEDDVPEQPVLPPLTESVEQSPSRQVPPLPDLPPLRGAGVPPLPDLPPLGGAGDRDGAAESQRPPAMPVPPLPDLPPLGGAGDTSPRPPAMPVPPLPDLPPLGGAGDTSQRPPAMPVPPLPDLPPLRGAGDRDGAAASQRPPAMPVPPLPDLPPLGGAGDRDGAAVSQRPPAMPVPPLPDLPPLRGAGDRDGEAASRRPPDMPVPPLPDLPPLGGAGDRNGADQLRPPSMPGLPSLPDLPPRIRAEDSVDIAPPLPAQHFQVGKRKNEVEELERQRHELDLKDMPDRVRPQDYLRVELLSPAQIRERARVRDDGSANGQVLHPHDYTEMQDSWEALPDGLYCERIFGARGTYLRRKKPGYIELAWPCAHVWFSGRGNLGSTARLLGSSASSIHSVRMFQESLFLGEWVAPPLWPLREDPLTKGPMVPQVGSPVAAAYAPKLRCLAIPSAREEPEANPDESASSAAQESMPWSREDCDTAQLLKAACAEQIPAEAAFQSRTLRKALAAAQSPTYADVDAFVVAGAVRLGAELPRLARDLDLILAAHRAGEVAEGAEGKSMLIAVALDSLRQQGLSSSQAAELLAMGMSSEDPSDEALRHFRAAAQEDLYGFWRSVAVPKFSGDLDATLTEIFAAVRGKVKLSETAKAAMNCKKLLDRCIAALDLAARAMTLPKLKEGSTNGKGRSRLSRYWPKQRELYWYDPSIAPAAFHLEDVERLAEAEHIAAAAAVPVSSPSSTANGKNGNTQKTMQARGLTTPDKRRRSCSAAYYRQEKADRRWHLPLQDAARPGCAGGLRPLSRGEVIPAEEATAWAQFAAARPRPSTMPLPVPGNMEAEGMLYVGKGAASLRQVLCDMDPASTLQALEWDIDRLEDTRAAQFKSPANRLKLDLASVSRLRKGASRLGTGAETTNRELLRRRNMMESVVAKHQLPEWLVFTSLPVLPPDLRTRSPNNPGEFPDDLNVMYKDVIIANRKLEVSLAIRDPANLLRYRQFELQKAVDNVIDNGRMHKGRAKSSGDEFESVTKRLKGKPGRMRKNMLGKRVDFSARTVIAVDPQLELDRCGLPYDIAKDMFQPFLLWEIQQYRKSQGSDDLDEELRQREKLEWFEDQPEELRWELLQKAMDRRPIILNRAPTLHRLSMQAFLPQLVSGKALKIHPLVCGPFNADFDGDTMTIHLVLSEAANEEARELMLPSRNLSSAASGDPSIGPSQDMVLGLYYMTLPAPESDVPPEVCKTREELESVLTACAAGELPHSRELLVPQKLLSELVPEDSALAEHPEDEIRTRRRWRRWIEFHLFPPKKLDWKRRKWGRVTDAGIGMLTALLRTPCFGVTGIRPSGSSRSLVAFRIRMAGFRNPHNLPVKDCIVCGRPFTWRKKWERCWDEVTTCSNRCRTERRRGKAKESGAAAALGAGAAVAVARKKVAKSEEGEESAEPESDSGNEAGDTGDAPAKAEENPGADTEESQDESEPDARTARKQRKAALKAERRARRAQSPEEKAAAKRKPCSLCTRRVDLLVRCQMDISQKWHMLCGRCWRDASGGVPDGDAEWRRRTLVRHGPRSRLDQRPVTWRMMAWRTSACCKKPTKAVEAADETSE
ncbi:unnamed protein product [Effrenium voratum]|nr:unnamed protein product [Effrenium voratum]